MVHFACLAGFHDDSDTGTLLGPHQVVMGRAGCKERAHGNAVLAGSTVGQHDEAVAVVHRLLGFLSNALERRLEPIGALASGPSDVDDLAAPPALANRLERGDLFVGQDRVRNAKPMRVLRGRVEQVLLRPDVALDSHDHFLANRIDRRIGDLSKQLLEVVIRESRLIAQNGERRVVAHRPDRIALLLDHWPQHELHRLGGVTKGLHARKKRVGVEAVRISVHWKLGQLEALLVEPLAVGKTRRDVILELDVGDHAPLLEVDKEHSAGLQAALVLHRLGCDREHADLRRHDHAVVVSEIVATRTKTITVENRTDDGPVRESNRGRAVPRLHQAGVVLVEITLHLRHVGVLLPGLGDHHHRGLGHRAPVHVQELQDVIERARVRQALFRDGEELAEVFPEELALHDSLPRVHRVLVAAQGIDLAVVAEATKRLRALPGREGVRRKARMHHREVGLEVRVGQIPVEGQHLLAGKHALVDDRLA